MKKALIKFKEMYKKNWMEWTLLIVVLLIATSVFLYRDLLDTINNSIIFIKSIATGNFLKFYDMTVLETSTNYAANYNLIIYVIYSIWLLPLYCITNLFNKNFMLWPISLFYSKLFLIMATILAAYLIHKIISECTDTKFTSPPHLLYFSVA